MMRSAQFFRLDGQLIPGELNYQIGVPVSSIDYHDARFSHIRLELAYNQPIEPKVLVMTFTLQSYKLTYGAPISTTVDLGPKGRDAIIGFANRHGISGELEDKIKAGIDNMLQEADALNSRRLPPP